MKPGDKNYFSMNDDDDFTFTFVGDEKPKSRVRRYVIPAVIVVAALGLTAYLYSNLAGAASADLTPVQTVAQADTNTDAPGNHLNALVPAAGTPAQTPALTPITSMPTPKTAATASAVAIPPGQTAAMPAALTPEPPPAANSIPAIGGAANAPGTAPAAIVSPMNGLPPAATSGAVSGTASLPVRPADTAGPAGPDVYYDANASTSIDPTLAAGPRKVSPAQEPASKYIIVNKDEGPQGISAQVVAANRALKLGHYDAACDMFDALYNKNPRDPRILMGRAVAYQNSGRDDTAMKMYDELLSIHPDDQDALLNMLGLLRKQYPEVALRRLINLHDKYPNNAMIAAQIGIAEADQNQFDDAMRYLTMAVSIEPNNAQHQFNLAVTADRAGHKDDALKYYQEALETDAVYGQSRSVPREKIYDRLAALRQMPSAAPVVQTTQSTASTHSSSSP